MTRSALLLVAYGLSSLSAYLFLVIAARSLGPDGFSALGAVLALQVMIGVPSGGVATAILVLVGRYRDRGLKGEACGALAMPLGALALATAVLAALLPVLGWIPAGLLHVESAVPLFAALVGIALTLGMTFARGALFGLGDVRGVAVSVVVESGARLGAAALALPSASDLTAGLLFYYAGTVAGLASAGVSLRPLISVAPSGVKLREFWDIASIGAAAYGLVSVVTSSDVPLARYYLSYEGAGAFAVSSSIAKVGLLVSAAVVDPALSGIAGAGARLQRYRTVRALALVAAACAVWTATCWLLPEWVYPTVFGPRYMGVGALVGPLSIAAAEAGVLYAAVKCAVVARSRVSLFALAVGAGLQLLGTWAFHRSALEMALVGVFASGIGLVLVLARLRAATNLEIAECPSGNIDGRQGTGGM